MDKATILYFNDAHEISPVHDHLGSRGGVARIKTIVDKVRMQNAQTIVVFGGDLAGGTLFGAVYKGFPMVEAFNLLPLDGGINTDFKCRWGETNLGNLITDSYSEAEMILQCSQKQRFLFPRREGQRMWIYL